VGDRYCARWGSALLFRNSNKLYCAFDYARCVLFDAGEIPLILLARFVTKSASYVHCMYARFVLGFQFLHLAFFCLALTNYFYHIARMRWHRRHDDIWESQRTIVEASYSCRGSSGSGSRCVATGPPR